MNAYSTHTDQELVALLKQGDQAAYQMLYRRYWEQTYNNAYKRLRDHDLAEDITQDIFLQLWAKREITEISNVGGYFYGAVRNSVYRMMEKQARFMPVSDLLEDLEVHGERADARLLTIEFMRAYEALVKALPEGQQTIFRMRFNEDMSPDEIAIALNLSPKTVRNQLGKALSTLKASLLMLTLIMTMLEK